MQKECPGQQTSTYLVEERMGSLCFNSCQSISAELLGFQVTREPCVPSDDCCPFAPSSPLCAAFDMLFCMLHQDRKALRPMHEVCGFLLVQGHENTLWRCLKVL